MKHYENCIRSFDDLQIQYFHYFIPHSFRTSLWWLPCDDIPRQRGLDSRRAFALKTWQHWGRLDTMILMTSAATSLARWRSWPATVTGWSGCDSDQKTTKDLSWPIIELAVCFWLGGMLRTCWDLRSEHFQLLGTSDAARDEVHRTCRTLTRTLLMLIATQCESEYDSLWLWYNVWLVRCVYIYILYICVCVIMCVYNNNW